MVAIPLTEDMRGEIVRKETLYFQENKLNLDKILSKPHLEENSGHFALMLHSSRSLSATIGSSLGLYLTFFCQRRNHGEIDR